MNKKLLYKIIVLDEIIKYRIDQNNIVLNEKQENYIKNAIKEQNPAAAAADSEDEWFKQGDEAPLPKEKQKEAEKSEGFLDKVKNKGFFGTYNDAVTGLMNSYMKFMFGAGAFKTDDQANKAVADMARTRDPQKAIDKMQKDTESIEKWLSTTPRAETPELNRMIQRLAGALDQVEDKVEASPEAESPQGPSKETPVSIFKRQKKDPSLRSQTGAVETPLNSYIQKDLKMSARAAQRIAKGIGMTLKSRGVPIAESKIEEINKILEQAMEKDKSLVANVVMKYVKRAGAKDASLQGVSSDDLFRMASKINKMLRRQLRRRGYDDNEIQSLLSSSGKLKETIVSSIKPLIEGAIKEQLQNKNGN